MTSDLKTTIVGVALIALAGYAFYAEVDAETIVAVIGALAGCGLVLAKDAKK